jgi:hypothetical protein
VGRRGDAWPLPGKVRTPRRPRMSEHEMELGEVVRKCHVCHQSFALQGDPGEAPQGGSRG